VLGPILFLLYVSELFDIIAECGFAGHTYADDMQVYISTSSSDHTDALRLFRYALGICTAHLGHSKSALYKCP